MENRVCLIHRYKFVKYSGVHNYYECKKCKHRIFKRRMLEGYSPIDYDWLNENKKEKKDG